MGVYAFNLLFVTLSSLIIQFLEGMKKKSVSHKYSFVFYITPLLSLILVSGFRYKVGTDYYTYAEDFVVFGEKMNWSLSSFGFNTLVYELHKITANPQIFFFVTSIIINICMVCFIKKYSVSFVLSMYFYITTFIYYGTMNGVRQYLASIFLIAGLKYIFDGKFKKYLICVLIASLFHSSALIMLIIYFLARRKVYSYSNLAFGGVIAAAFIFYQPFVNFLFGLLQSSEYGYYKNEMVNTSNGVNVLRILVWMVPVIFILLYRERAEKVYGEKVNIIINLCIYGMLFMILAYRHVFYARICMYFDVYYLLLLPMICKLFDKKTNAYITTIISVCYLAYSVALLLQGECWIYPYKYNFKIF